jgi:hypothetical protein
MQHANIICRMQLGASGYSGVHWVEAFVVKNGYCVARSGRKYVNLA